MIGLLKILQEVGNEIRKPYSKYLTNGIFEIRCEVGNNLARVLYFFGHDRTIVLTNGFIKKTKKTPNKEIEMALEFKNDYSKRIKPHENI